MNLTVIVDQRHTYKQAVQIAYEKAKQLGDVDPQTEMKCEWIRNCPEPAAQYYERDMSEVFGTTSDGCTIGRSWSSYDMYEQLKIDGKKAHARSMADTLGKAMGEFLNRVSQPHPGWAAEDLAFTVNERSEIRFFSKSGIITAEHCARLSDWANQETKLQSLATDYIMALASVVNRTREGLSAEYAKYFASSW